MAVCTGDDFTTVCSALYVAGQPVGATVNRLDEGVSFHDSCGNLRKLGF